jgi:hypothetical protein
MEKTPNKTTNGAPGKHRKPSEDGDFIGFNGISNLLEVQLGL